MDVSNDFGGDLPSCRRLDFEGVGDSPKKEGNGDEIFDSITEKSDEITIEKIHMKMSKEDIPHIGMEFVTEEAAHKFYNDYAKQAGFGTRISKAHTENGSGRILDRIFCCNREGYREKDKRDANVKAHRSETRCGCRAMLKVNCRINGKYQVTNFVAEHVHCLTSPSKTYLHWSHRRIAPAQAVEANMIDSSGICPKKAIEYMSRQVGGRENLGFIPLDYRNYLRSKRTVEMKVGDTGGVLEYLQKMKTEDLNFFYAIQVDEDDLITNIFWADGMMMADYSCFGDVVCFDTTYRKHKDGRPIALFVGVNHHKQTTIFGVALLYDETHETFIWLFSTFAKAMSGKKPMTILTDQGSGIVKGLASEWPEVFHRLCIWHIYQNAAMSLSAVFARFKNFVKDFSSCIYDYEEEEDFIGAWNEMLHKYNLHENEWLNCLFKIKEKWALVYGRQTFCADMTTTQRSESMNSVIKRYVSYKHDLLQFFHHFERLINERRCEESIADFRECSSSPSISFPVEILKHAATVYTLEAFKWFQGELCKTHDCSMHFLDESGTIAKYNITPYRKNYHHIVTYDLSEGTISCSCKKFEFSGILCSHALKVLNSKNVVKIPEQYILKRWTKRAKKGIVFANSVSTIVEGDPKAMMVIRYKDLCRLYTQLVTRASGNERSYEIAKCGIETLMEQVDLSLDKVNEKPSKPEQHPNTHIDDTLGDGSIPKVKGIKPKPLGASKSSKRPKGALERAIRKNKSKGKNKSALRNNMDFVADVIEEDEESRFNNQFHRAADRFYVSNSMNGSVPPQLLPSIQHVSPHFPPLIYPPFTQPTQPQMYQEDYIARNHQHAATNMFSIPPQGYQ